MSEIVIYTAGSGAVEVRVAGENVWLRQEQMAALFGRDRTVIGRHVRNVFAEGELERESNVQNLHIAGSDKPVSFFNLDVIISVGYRVKSPEGVRFRQPGHRRAGRRVQPGCAEHRHMGHGRSGAVPAHHGGFRASQAVA